MATAVELLGILEDLSDGELKKFIWFQQQQAEALDGFPAIPIPLGALAWFSVVSSTRVLAVHPLGSEGCGFGPSWVELVAAQMLDQINSLETRSMSCFVFFVCFSSAFFAPEQFLWHGCLSSVCTKFSWMLCVKAKFQIPILTSLSRLHCNETMRGLMLWLICAFVYTMSK